jgi:hypothetical protein
MLNASIVCTVTVTGDPALWENRFTTRSAGVVFVN